MAEKKKEPLREGDPQGPPTVLFDEKKHQNYHLSRTGEVVFHEVPEGYRFDKDGVLVEKEPAGEKAVETVKEQVNDHG